VAELGGRIAEFTGVTIYDAESGFLNHKALIVQFYMDANGRLIGHTVKMVPEK
jgi:hypothetical protein